jgi:hypothetical protein
MTEKSPQDRKKKAAESAYTFTVSGKRHVLPDAAAAAAHVSGRFLRDAALNGEEGQLALGFATLEAAGASDAAINALYDLPAGEMLEHIQAWMTFKAAPEDASVGESSRLSN